LPSQDCVLIHYLIDLPRSFLDFGRRARAYRRGAAADLVHGPILRLPPHRGLPRSVRTPARGGTSHVASGRLLFLAVISLGLYRPQGIPRRGRSPWSCGQPQAGGPGRPVLRNRRAAAGQASPGAAALPHGRTAALARQARPEFPPATGSIRHSIRGWRTVS